MPESFFVLFRERENHCHIVVTPEQPSVVTQGLDPYRNVH